MVSKHCAVNGRTVIEAEVGRTPKPRAILNQP